MDVTAALARLEWRGLLLTAAVTAGWLALLSRAPRPRAPAPDPARPVALVVGALAFVPSILVVQVPLQQAVTRWAMANLATASPLVTLLPAVLLSGLVQEPVKALAAGMARGVAARSPVVGRGTAAGLRSWTAVGLFAGAGYGAAEAWLALSLTLTTPGVAVPHAAAAVAERVAALGFHTAATGLALLWWARRGPRGGLMALALLSLYHGLLNYAVPLARSGVLSGPAMQGYVWVVALVPAVYLLWLTRREPRA